MRTLIIIMKRGAGYVVSASDQSGPRQIMVRCGLTPYDAAARATVLMMEHGRNNPEGGDIMAPPEVMEFVPEHLRSIQPQTHS